MTFRLPYTGSHELWNTVPKGELIVFGVDNPLGPVVVGGDDHLLIHLPAAGQTPATIRNDRLRVIGHLTTKVKWANQQVDGWNERLRAEVHQLLLHRVDLAEQGAALDATSDVPLYRAPAGEQVPIPIERKALRPSENSDGTAATADSADPVMAQEIYADIVQTIEQMTLAMERTPTAAKLDEEEIRNLILFVLNANYRGAAVGEVFNGEGKTDILLRWEDSNAFIGECKFWKGQKAFGEAIDQMLGYVTWRDTKAALIVFMRGGQPTEIMEKAKAVLRTHASFESESPNGTTTRGDFVLRSKRDEDRLISVALIGVVIPDAKGGSAAP
ncbi:hypothetical protein [Rhodococcus opacus]|uniref:hypothetical protein n=1 Tax=Rhodococcus opacus TaxID=37919 RepID=UPI002235C278|nr:hypothetical protein [Rhodococcus opacus]UZG60387.1 hypothetical protein ONE62_42795 [Rhodococcus opacus]